MSQSDGFAITHILIKNGVGRKNALEVAGHVDRVAEVLKEKSRNFLAPTSIARLEILKMAWASAVGDGHDVNAIESEELRQINPREGYELFALAEDRTFQTALDAAVTNSAVKTLCETTWGPTGSEMRDELGQRLMHAVRTSLGDKLPEAPIAWVLGSNSFARVICRNVKYCLHVYAAHVLRGDDVGAERFRPLVEELSHALPLAHGTFRGTTGPIFMVGNRQP